MKPEDILNYCGGCGSFRCVCPTRRTNRYIDRIQTFKVKARRYVTRIYGELETQDFKKMKDLLGTGGTLYKDHFEFRGTATVKLLEVLQKLGYRVAPAVQANIPTASKAN